MATQIVVNDRSFNNSDQLNIADFTSAVSLVCALPSGYQLAHHPDLTTWLVIGQAGAVHVADESHRAFKTTGDVFSFVRRRLHASPVAVATRPLVAAFDAAFVDGVR